MAHLSDNVTNHSVAASDTTIGKHVIRNSRALDCTAVILELECAVPASSVAGASQS